MARRRAATFSLVGAAGQYRLTGTADMASARALLEQGLGAFRGQSQVAVDLSGVTATDGAGLAVLLSWVERARAAGQVLAFQALPAQLLALARVCDVEAMLGAAATPGASPAASA
jgi:phospholipid transport system transporter-binding protein